MTSRKLGTDLKEYHVDMFLQNKPKYNTILYCRKLSVNTVVGELAYPKKK